MNLFRSEETVLAWSQTDPAEGGGTMTAQQAATMFSADMFRRRLDADYLEKLAGYRKEMAHTMVEAGLTGPAFMRPRTD